MMDPISKVLVKAMKKKWFESEGNKKTPPFKYRIIGAKKKEDKYYTLEVEVKFHKMNIFEKLIYFYRKPKERMEMDAIMSIIFECKKNEIDLKVFGINSILVNKATIKFF